MGTRRTSVYFKPLITKHEGSSGRKRLKRWRERRAGEDIKMFISDKLHGGRGIVSCRSHGRRGNSFYIYHFERARVFCHCIKFGTTAITTVVQLGKYFKADIARLSWKRASQSAHAFYIYHHRLLHMYRFARCQLHLFKKKSWKPTTASVRCVLPLRFYLWK